MPKKNRISIPEICNQEEGILVANYRLVPSEVHLLVLWELLMKFKQSLLHNPVNFAYWKSALSFNNSHFERILSHIHKTHCQSTDESLEINFNQWNIIKDIMRTCKLCLLKILASSLWMKMSYQLSASVLSLSMVLLPKVFLCIIK